MHNWLKHDLDYLIETLKKDIELIAQKEHDDEWKRDHYRYTVTVMLQRIYNLLNTTITSDPPAPIKESTRKELFELHRIIYKMLNSGI